MQRRGWIVITVLTLVVTGIVLTQVRRVAANRALRAAPRRVELRGHVNAAMPFASEAAARWRHCQPTHWRACLLQR